MISAVIKIVYLKNRNVKLKEGEIKNYRPTAIKEYRIKSDSLKNIKDLLKREIDNIDKKYRLKNVVSIKFTG